MAASFYYWKYWGELTRPCIRYIQMNVPTYRLGPVLLDFLHGDFASLCAMQRALYYESLRKADPIQ